MTPQDDWRGLYDEAVRQCNAHVNTITHLEAEVAQLRQERDNCEHGYQDQIRLYNEMRAARDRLRARLHQQIQQWHESAAGEVENSNTQYAQALDQCAADLLAVLTEPEEKK